MFEASNILQCLRAYDKVKASPSSTEKERNDAYDTLLRSIFQTVVRHGGAYRFLSHENVRHLQRGRSEEQFFYDEVMQGGSSVFFAQTVGGQAVSVEMKVCEVRVEESDDRDDLVVEGFVCDSPEAEKAGLKSGQRVSVYARQLDDLYPLILCVHGLHDEEEKLALKKEEAGE